MFRGEDFSIRTKDIKGAWADTKKKGIVTDRQTNPLNPDYKYLGAKELGEKFYNNPYDNYRPRENKPEESKVKQQKRKSEKAESVSGKNDKVSVSSGRHPKSVGLQDYVSEAQVKSLKRDLEPMELSIKDEYLPKEFIELLAKQPCSFR